MAHHRWISLRARRIQGDLMSGMQELEDNYLSIPGVVTRDLPLYILYQNTADRAFHKSHEALPKGSAAKEKIRHWVRIAKAPLPAYSRPQKPPQNTLGTPRPDPKPIDLASFQTEEELKAWMKTATRREMLLACL